MRTKVTDLFIKYANFILRKQNCEEIQEQIYSRYAQIGKYFSLSMQGLNEIRALIKELPSHNFLNHDYFMATFKAYREFLNAKLLTMIMKKQGLKVRLLTPRQAGLIVTGIPNDAIVILKPTLICTIFNLIRMKKLSFLAFMELLHLETWLLFRVVDQILQG